MTGVWLTRCLSALLHHDTFDLFVAPAIADLQHSRTAAAYGVVWTSLLGAMSHDIAGDVERVCNDVGLMLGLIAIQTCYYGGLLLLLVAHVRIDEALHRLTGRDGALLTGAVVALIVASTIPTLFCFWPPRRTLDA